MADRPDARALADLAAAVAVEASDLLVTAVAERGGGGPLEVRSKSSPTDWVTEWDRASERLIRARLGAARPDDGILGEEEGDVAGTSGVRWVVDPIDGTTNFVYGLPPFSVSIAAEVDGAVVAGVVADVLHGEVYVAAAGGGATRNGEVIGVSDCTDLTHALVGTGFAYDPARRRRQAAVLVGVLPHVRDLRRGGAASVDLCWVACGRLDAFWERGLGPWDHAAGALVAREAGAVVGDLGDGPVSGHMAFASTPAIAAELRVLLSAAGAADA
jgi:myo-inositol-1(or 4)-monophosphatase